MGDGSFAAFFFLSVPFFSAWTLLLRLLFPRKITSIFFSRSLFLDASSHLYKRVCPSVRSAITPSLKPFRTHLIVRQVVSFSFSLFLSFSFSFFLPLFFFLSSSLFLGFFPCFFFPCLFYFSSFFVSFFLCCSFFLSLLVFRSFSVGFSFFLCCSFVLSQLLFLFSFSFFDFIFFFSGRKS